MMYELFGSTFFTPCYLGLSSLASSGHDERRSRFLLSPLLLFQNTAAAAAKNPKQSYTRGERKRLSTTEGIRIDIPEEFSNLAIICRICCDFAD